MSHEIISNSKRAILLSFGLTVVLGGVLAACALMAARIALPIIWASVVLSAACLITALLLQIASLVALHQEEKRLQEKFQKSVDNTDYILYNDCVNEKA